MPVDDETESNGTGTSFDPSSEELISSGANMTKLRSLESGRAEHCTMQDLLEAEDPFEEAFECGDELFDTEFNAIDGVGARVGNGQRFTRAPRADKRGTLEWSRHIPARATGPNAQSCSACHGQNVPDGAGPAAGNVHRDPIGGGLLHLMIQRNAPHVHGLGALQKLAEEMTMELKADAAAGRPLESKGVSFGSASNPRGVAKDLIVRPYQWKGSVATVREFMRDAGHNELGMQGVEITGDNVDGDGDGVANELGIGDITALAVYQAAQPRPVTKIELNTLGLLDPPLTAGEISQIKAGEAVFNRAGLGCVVCHKPALTLNDPIFSEPSKNPLYRDATFPAGQNPISRLVDPAKAISFDLTKDLPDNPIPVGSTTLGNHEPNGDGGAIIRLYGDLKRHFMGGSIVAAGVTTGLAEQISEIEPGVFTGEGPATFMTENLWGVGSTGPYLHDGRATTITEAILEHGGEAKASKDAFSALSTTDAKNLLAFLNNLTLFLPEEE
jgi:mono/diheme cytochrome c family protein